MRKNNWWNDKKSRKKVENAQISQGNLSVSHSCDTKGLKNAFKLKLKSLKHTSSTGKSIYEIFCVGAFESPKNGETFKHHYFKICLYFDNTISRSVLLFELENHPLKVSINHCYFLNVLPYNV